MLQNLLAERFHMVVHHETKEYDGLRFAGREGRTEDEKIVRGGLSGGGTARVAAAVIRWP
jgi:hypothetical protein